MMKKQDITISKLHFILKTHFPKILLLVLFMSFSSDSAMNPFTVNMLYLILIGEHIGISTLTKKQVKPKNSYISDHLLLINHSASYNDFSILMRENEKFVARNEREIIFYLLLHHHYYVDFFNCNLKHSVI